MSHYKTIQALGTPHVTHQGIVAMLDDFELAVMLSHLMYWADKTDNPLGVYRSNADWYELFRFKEAKVKKLSDELQKRGLITKTHKRLEHRIYYLFNADEFDRQYEQFANLKNDHSPIAKTKIGEAQKSGLADSENQGSLYTKITTKNTTKITTESEYAPTHENEQTHFADEKNPPNPSANKPTSKTSSAKKSTTTKKHLTADDLVAVGVSEQVANDYLATRKTKLTQTALDGIIKQANLANIPLDTAIRFTIEQGWQSFKAEWYANRQEKQPKPTWQQTPKPNRKSELQALASAYGDDFYSRNSQTPTQNYQDPQIGENHE